MCHAYVPVLIKIVYVYSWSSNLNNLLKARNNLRLVPHLVVGFLYILLCLNDELKPFPLGHCMCKESVWQKTKQRRSTNWHKSLHNQSVGLSVGLSVPPPKKNPPHIRTYMHAPIFILCSLLCMLTDEQKICLRSFLAPSADFLPAMASTPRSSLMHPPSTILHWKKYSTFLAIYILKEPYEYVSLLLRRYIFTADFCAQHISCKQKTST